jgi:hypothetical protein
MESLQWNIATVANVIDISVAPVFLLAGISGLLMVLTNRLGRTIDRSRSLQAAETEFMPDQRKYAIEREMTILIRRIHLNHLAIGMATVSAILVCLVVITLFMGNLVRFNVSVFIASLFIVCMSFLSLAFIAFLIEVLISTGTLKTSLINTVSFRDLNQTGDSSDSDS